MSFFPKYVSDNVTCPYCNQLTTITHTLGPDDDFCSDIFDEDRGMGPEIEHSTEAIHICSHCNKEINVLISLFEYPTGTLNYAQINVI